MTNPSREDAPYNWLEPNHRMNLPNYFLADQPPEAILSKTLITEACQTLRRNRERFLIDRPSEQLIRLYSELAADWQRPEFPYRKMALAKGPEAAGFSPATLAKGLDSFFSQVTSQNLRLLLMQDLGHEERLDRFQGIASAGGRATPALARGPALLVHIASGNIPNPILMSLLLGQILRSAQVIKCATGTSLIPRLFAHSLRQRDSKLASCLEIVEWPGGQAELETALFRETDCLTATGRDETLRDIRRRLPDRVRFLGYGHKVSLAYVACDNPSHSRIQELAARAAEDIVAWDQLGCLSPHVIYVEAGGSLSPEQFAASLAEELARIEKTEPRGPVPTELASLIRIKRDFYQIRADQSPDTLIWSSPDSTAWTVVFENDPLFQTSCLHRFIHVKPIHDLPHLFPVLETVRGQVSTVGLAAPPDRRESMAQALAQWGVSRICPLGQMQRPPLTWRHDGRPALGDLTEWTDYEGF